MHNDLYKKYKAAHCKQLPPLNPLIFILRKAELGLKLTASEWNWLDNKSLLGTKEMIKNQEDYRDSLLKEIKRELYQLRQNKFVYFSINTVPTVDAESALVLYKVNAQERLADCELRFVGNGYHLFLEFNERKKRYGITDEIPFDKNAVKILSKIESQAPLCYEEIKWLSNQNAESFLKPLQSQFERLKKKFNVSVNKETVYKLFDFFQILQKMEEKKLLDEAEAQYLKTSGFIETLEIAQKMEFLALKQKYRAEQIQEGAVSHHLYKVLKKLEAGISLPEPDINYLKKRKLHETIKLAYKKEADSLREKINRRDELDQEDIVWCEEHNFTDIIFSWLIHEYQIAKDKYREESPLYSILKKLNAGVRLSDEEVIWLEGENLLRPSSKIYIVHHRLEALFYEKEFLQTKSHWNLVNASAHWRKAENPNWALKQTDRLVYKHIKPAKLRAALLTTRGGALRDINELGDAEKCALEAIDQYPDSHNPFTLMGALCYDTGRYDEGDRWFEEAVKRGAKPQDQDAEIKRILRKMKRGRERKELINHLLKKNPVRFDWARRFETRNSKQENENQ